MTPHFSGRNAQWVKEYQGRVYKVTCKQLDLPKNRWSPVGSWKAANAWWLRKKEELDRPEQLALEGEREFLVAAQQVREKQIKELLAQRAETLNKLDPAAFPLVKDATPTVRATLDSWLSLALTRAKPSSRQFLRKYRKKFGELLGEESHVSVLTIEKIEELYLRYKGTDPQKWPDQPTEKKEYSFLRQYVAYACLKARVPVPPNLHSKLHTFKTRVKVKDDPEPEKVKPYLDALSERLRLYCLLMLNCSMNNIDVAHIKQSDVDWTRRTLTRRRIKTEDKPKTPRVTYKLWDETYALLQKLGDRTGEYVVTASDGTGLYRQPETNGPDDSGYDRIKASYRDYFGVRNKNKKIKRQYTLRDFRTIGGDLIGKGPFHHQKEPFLCHSVNSEENSVSAANYSSNVSVVEACYWLAKQFGYAVAAPGEANG